MKNAKQTVTVTVEQIAAMVEQAAQKAVAEYKAANPSERTFTPSTFKIVLVDNIPAKSGRKWATVEITDQRTGEVTSCFLDRRVDAGKRKDGADQTVIYATIREERPQADAKPDAKPVAKRASRKAVAAAVAAS